MKLPKKWTWEVRMSNIVGGYDVPAAFRLKWMATVVAWAIRPKGCEPGCQCVRVARFDDDEDGWAV